MTDEEILRLASGADGDDSSWCIAFARIIEAETIRRVREACAVECNRQGGAADAGDYGMEARHYADAIRALFPEVKP